MIRYTHKNIFVQPSMYIQTRIWCTYIRSILYLSLSPYHSPHPYFSLSHTLFSYTIISADHSHHAAMIGHKKNPPPASIPSSATVTVTAIDQNQISTSNICVLTIYNFSHFGNFIFCLWLVFLPSDYWAAALIEIEQILFQWIFICRSFCHVHFVFLFSFIQYFHEFDRKRR